MMNLHLHRLTSCRGPHSGGVCLSCSEAFFVLNIAPSGLCIADQTTQELFVLPLSASEMFHEEEEEAAAAASQGTLEPDCWWHARRCGSLTKSLCRYETTNDMI